MDDIDEIVRKAQTTGPGMTSNLMLPVPGREVSISYELIDPDWRNRDMEMELFAVVYPSSFPGETEAQRRASRWENFQYCGSWRTRPATNTRRTGPAAVRTVGAPAAASPSVIPTTGVSPGHGCHLARGPRP